jgi:hypothetical protein
MDTYKIIKFYQSGEREIVDTGLYLAEAQEYCKQEDTAGDGWFCGYAKE